MHSTRFQAIAAAVLSAIAPACADSPSTGPTPSRTPSVLSFTNGPSELPNVIRFEGEGGVGVIADTEADLLLLVGLPENPLDAVDCGGSEPFDQISVQLVGVLTGVLQALLKSEPRLHVYQLSAFTGLCSSTPFAQGSGRLTVTDNDVMVSGTRTNSFGASVTGEVSFTSGGSAQLSAHARFLIHPDGTFVVVSQQIRLSR